VEAIEKHVKDIQLAASENQKTKRVNQIVLSVQRLSNYLVSGVSDKVDKVPKTFAELRIRMASSPYESLESELSAGTFYARAQGATGSRETGGAGRGAAVHTDAYVNRLKRRLHLAEEVAMKHGATQEELKRDSKAHPTSQSNAPFSS
jgi:hypothetical protein